MPKASTEEVQVLRFFETGSLDKVEAVFNIVCEKMRERLGKQPGAGERETVADRRRRRARHAPDSSLGAPPSGETPA